MAKLCQQLCQWIAHSCAGLFAGDETLGESHEHLPYRWQVKDSGRGTWKDLPDMEEIEKAYCDPGRDTSGKVVLPLQSFLFFKKQPVKFMTMTCGGSAVRRLTTTPSASNPQNVSLSTQWLWYWKDNNGNWMEYGKGNTAPLATVTSQALEGVYQANIDTEIQFKVGDQMYTLHFKGETGGLQMYQQNMNYKTKREVRRRPLFVSAQDVVIQSQSAHISRSSTAESFPSYWDKTALPDIGYKLIPLSKSEEYEKIKMTFNQTMSASKIHKIQRIQNPSLWKVFHLQREQMKKRNRGKAVKEKYLFHGTNETLIEAICDQNFDWRMCGANGTSYGRGSYFAREASYSDSYVRVKEGQQRTMFVALVLVGEYIKGSSSYVRPPLKADNKTLYDSCVDNERNPSIYVVFEKQQIYPEYLINYSKTQ
ncbi:protein mono-ADP-ribosyltransferase PARP12-like [Cheilinus undulatus]|uniref:protein mono-ADP-ribosyltransferase PARP12-like n=1 Tax=Cheilinus undulatus TaxID=241271 RepID=UPI001BD3F125|nr:protein mono-ADP-ribosyltransferase PARP12-like [Cheilinus undulatus]